MMIVIMVTIRKIHSSNSRGPKYLLKCRVFRVSV